MTAVDERLVNEFLGMPVFSRLANDLGYRSVGVRIIDNDKVIQEFTSSYVKNKVKLIDSIKNPDFVVTVDRKFLKSLTKEKLGWIKANPLKAYIKYRSKVDIPFFVKLKVLGVLRE